MKDSCDIVKDLLPLYLENMASGDSRQMIEEHISECGACRTELESIRTSMILPPETDVEGLKKLDRQIRRRRTHATVLAILVTATVLFSIFMYLYSPVYLSVEEAVASVTERGDTVIVELSAHAEYCRWVDSVDPDTGRKSVTFIAARHRWNVLLEWLGGNRIEDVAEQEARQMHLIGNKDIWYASTAIGEEDTLLWGNESGGGRVSLPRLVLGYYFILALLCGVVLLIPALILRKKIAGKVIGTGALLCFSFALSDLIATGGNWRIYDGYDVPILLRLMLIQTVLLTSSMIFAVRVYKTGREDMGC